MSVGDDSGTPLWYGCGADPIPTEEVPACPVCHTRLPLFRLRAPVAGGQFRWWPPDLGRRLALAGAGGDDGGAVCRLRQRCIPDWRRGPVRHALETVGPPTRLPDHLRLRGPRRRRQLAHRPLAQAGLRPVTRRRGGSWPANRRCPAWRMPSIGRSCYRIAVALGEVYLREREREGVRRRTSSWIWTAPTTRPTGQQEGSAYHGYYRQHMDHPLLYLTARPASSSRRCCVPAIPGSAGVVTVLKRVVRACAPVGLT